MKIQLYEFHSLRARIYYMQQLYNEGGKTGGLDKLGSGSKQVLHSPIKLG